ncbi:MAG: hypothetical protein DIU80_021885 [Chloroflexota bacterium]|nr:MAG: hypothetical protein DIU80_06545 [Chloroflexota bacterium]
MTHQTSQSDGAAIEQLVRQVRGVQAVRVVHDSQGQIDELHVVGTPERSAKAIVRDIESILLVRGGIRINHRKVSLVQIPENPALAGGARLQLLDVVQVEGDGQPGVGVLLGNGDQQLRGSAAPLGGDETQEQLVGRATLDALAQLVGARGRFQLERIERRHFGEVEICLAHVSLLAEDALETLLGVSIVRGDTLRAPARAVLDAVNRRLPSLVNASPRQAR